MLTSSYPDFISGYGTALDAPGDAYFGAGDGGIYLDNVSCDGTEDTLLDCTASIDNHDCSHSEDAGVVCELHVNGKPCCLVSSTASKFLIKFNLESMHGLFRNFLRLLKFVRPLALHWYTLKNR